jgi:hypothetical protein
MRVRVSDPRIAPEIALFVQRMGFVTSPQDGNTICVSHPDAPDDVARLELDLYLALWKAINDEYRVVLTADTR